MNEIFLIKVNGALLCFLLDYYESSALIYDEENEMKKFKSVAMFLIMMLGANMAAQAGASWCQTGVYIVGIDMNVEGKTWNDWAIRVNSQPKSSSSDKFYYANLSNSDTSTTNGKALYALAMSAMASMMKVDIGDDKGSRCDDFDLLRVHVN